MKKLLFALLLMASPALAQWQVPNGAIPVGRGGGVSGFNSVAGSSGAGSKCLVDTTPPTFGTCPSAGAASLIVGTSTVTGGTTSTPLLNVAGVLANGTRSGNTTSFATTTGTLTSGNCVRFDASGNIIDAGTTCGSSYTPLRVANPGNLYVSKSGSDSNTCLGSGAGAACLTIGKAAAQAQLNYDLQGASLTINVAAGVYVENITFNGPAGLGGPGKAHYIIKGAGSGTTSINPSSNCGGVGNTPVTVSTGARVGLGSIKLTTTCSGGNDLLIYNNSIAFPVDSDLNFGPGTSSLVTIVSGSAFDANYVGNFPITISGGSVFGFLISTQSRVVTGAGVTNTITGTPNFTGSFIDAIDGSFFNWGSSSTWSGSATGVRYGIALNSYVDSEQIATPLPGDLPGTVGSGSYYYTNGTLTCISGAASCRIGASQSGWGSGSSYGVVSGSGDQAGSFSGTAGTGASSTGTIVLVTPSVLTGPVDTAGFCVVSLSHLNSTWPAGSTVQSYYSSGAIFVRWDSNGSALVNGNTYYFNYICQ